MEILEVLKYFWATMESGGSFASAAHVAFFRGKDSTRAALWTARR
jgi:hypothetical protein